MFFADCLNVNDAGHLTIGGADTLALAEAFGTPVYVVDETQVRKNMRAYKRALDTYYGGHGLPLYASKAFSCKEICRIASEEGLGLDVVSAGELYTALQAGFNPEKIYFHGNNKTLFELEYALRERVGQVVVDNITELETLDALAAKTGQKQKILLRIKPGIDAHTHDFIRTGQIDSKFGFALETGEAFAAARRAAQTQSLELVGVHCHIGSQIFETEPFALAAALFLDFLEEVQKQLGLVLPQMNLGGGIGIHYDEDDDALPYAAHCKAIAEVIDTQCAQRGLPRPFLLLEPGRSIPGPAGITLYTVGAVKEIPHVRTYVTVDGGMGDNPRYILYGAKYTILCANRAGDARTQTVTVAGRYCESGDLIQEFTKLQPVAPGDVLAVLATGAYNYSMGMRYNRVPAPPVVMITDGKPRVIIKGETLEDVARLDV
ncbi:MAG: diaminopimelate decarboxylase [Oscillospiraceae bacterium]|jgi:diaminopimelate decarboxylase|nr:diaminopimelate decarboxylase [Oscillospiraceae bacterium]